MTKKAPRSETIKLIKQELKIDTAKITEEDKTKGKTFVVDGKMDKVVKIAKERMDNLSSRNLKAAVKTILGSINSMNGILIEGKKPQEVIKEINEGKWDHLIK